MSIGNRDGGGAAFLVPDRHGDQVVVVDVGACTVPGEPHKHRVGAGEFVVHPRLAHGPELRAAPHAPPVAFFNNGIQTMREDDGSTSTLKRIIVDRTRQKLYAYEGDVLFMKESISTGVEMTPTPRGVFTIYKKTPSRYMQGPIKGMTEQYYDLPGVPWNLYFSHEGAVIHGAYWHDKFGQRWSHGCVNLSLESAKKLYEWADVGTKVTVRD